MIIESSFDRALPVWFSRLGSHDEARRTAKAALDMADSDEARREAERLLASIPTPKQSE